MTNKEAIEIIQNEYKCVNCDCDIERSCGKCPYMMPTKEPILKAYDMAIKALSQEPCDDANREAVQIAMALDNISDIAKDIKKKLPSVQPKPLGNYEIPSKPKEIWNTVILKDKEPCTDTVSREAVIKTINNNTADERDGWLCIDNDLVHEIEKLPSVNPQPCDDVISRDAVLDLYDRYRPSLATHVSEFGDELKALPSVTQKSGRWIDHSDEGYVECPFCGHATNCEDNIDELHYCFYCGAKLESEE